MSRNWKKRKVTLRSLGALLLAIVMVTSLVPMAVFAMELDDGDDETLNDSEGSFDLDGLDGDGLMPMYDEDGNFLGYAPPGETGEPEIIEITEGAEIVMSSAEVGEEDEEEEGEESDSVFYAITLILSGEVYDVLSGEDGDDYTLPMLSSSLWPEGAVSFRGWFSSLNPGDSDESFVVSGTFNADVGDVTLYAVFSSEYLVKYKDGPNGQVVDSKRFTPGSTVVGTSLTITPPEGSRLLYWYVEEDWNGTGTPAQFSFGSVTASRDITLVPWFFAEYFVFFVSDGTQVPFATVTGNSTATQPDAPSRTGYDFSHWSLTPGGAAYDWNAPVNEDLFLYAVWVPQTVNYEVVYWVEKPNVAGDPGLNQDNYIFYRSEVKQAQAGSIADHTTAAGLMPITVTTTSTSGNNTKTGTATWAEFRHGQSKEVLGNGTTVINVYFKRIEFTFNFNLSPGNSSNPTATPNSTNYTSIARRGATIVFANGFGTYGQGHNPDNGSEYSPSYSFTAKYEQNIENIWPSSANASITRTERLGQRTGNSRNYQYSWADTTTTVMREWNVPSNITNLSPLVTKRFTITADLLPTNNATVTFTAVWGSTRNVNVNYHLERLLIETGGTQRSFTGVTPNRYYIISAEHSQPLVLGSDRNLSAKQIEGATHVGNGGTYNASTVQYDFYYTRNRYTVSFNTVGGSPVSSITDVMYGEPLSYSGYDTTFNTVPAKTVDGINYTFIGWYLDADYNIPFDRGSMTMPNSHLTLFARWESTALKINFFNDLTTANKIDEKGIGYNENLRENETPYTLGQIVEGKGTFDGWYVYIGNTNFTMRFSYDTPVTTDLNLHAVWKVNGFTVIYDLNGGGGSTPSDSNNYWAGKEMRADSGSGITPPAGMVFLGWLEENTGKFCYPGVIFTLYGNAKFVAQYGNADEFIKITFNSNYPAGRNTDIIWQVRKNSTFDLAASNLFTYSGNSIIGWSRSGGLNNTADYECEESYKIGTADVTLYAVWEFNGWTVRFLEGNNGTFNRNDDSAFPGIPDSTAWDDAGISEPRVIADNGWYFTGWDKAFPESITQDWEFTAQYAEQAAITIKADSGEKVYDGTALTIGTASVTSGDLKDGDRLVVTMTPGSTVTHVSEGERINVIQNWAIMRGSVDVSGEYSVIRENGTLKILPAPLTVKTDPGEKVYDGTALTKGGEILGIVEGETYSFTVTGSQKDAGTSDNSYTLIFDGTAKESNYYLYDEDIGELEVFPKPAFIRALNASKLYGDNDPAFRAVDYGFLDGEAPEGYTVERTNSTVNAIGRYRHVLVVTDIDAEKYPNYDIRLIPGNFRITDNPAFSMAINVIAGSDIVTYDGTTHILDTWIIEEEAQLNAAGFTIEVDNDGAKAKDATGSSPAPNTITAVTVTYNGQVVARYTSGQYGPEDDVALNVIDGTLTVLPRPVLISADEAGKIYGTDDPELTATVEEMNDGRGFVDGDDELIYSVVREIVKGDDGKYDDAGEYTIYVISDESGNPNYIIETQTNIFTITPRPVTIIAGSGMKVYGSESPDIPELTDRVRVRPATEDTGLVNGDRIEYELIRRTGENVGLYRTAVTVDEQLYPNYIINTVSGLFTITPRVVVLGALDFEITVGEYADDDEIRADGRYEAYIHPSYSLVGEDELTYSVGRLDKSMGAGEYKIYVFAYPWQNTNYLLYFIPGTLTINPAASPPPSDDPSPSPSPDVTPGPTDPTDPADPGTDPTDPTDPADTTDPTDPTDPATDPADSTEPGTEPATDPADSTEPGTEPATDPVDSTEPGTEPATDPVEPVEPPAPPAPPADGPAAPPAGPGPADGPVAGGPVEAFPVLVPIEDAPVPLAQAPADPPPADQIPDVILVDVVDPDIPLVEIGQGSSWALWNLILSILCIILALAMGVRALSGNRKKEDDQLDDDPKDRRKSLLFGLAVPVTAIIACIIFILTQDMTTPMAQVDRWTLAHAALFAAGLVSFIFADRKVKEDEQEANPA